MSKLFLDIGDGEGSWRRRIGDDMLYHDLAPSEYQICIRISSEYLFKRGSVHKDLFMKSSAYMGCWFIKNPMLNMHRIDFISLITKINKTINERYTTNDKNCPIFEGLTYSKMYIKLVNCMKEIIELFKSETGNNDWSYYDGLGTVSVEKRIKKADEFVKNWKK